MSGGRNQGARSQKEKSVKLEKDPDKKVCSGCEEFEHGTARELPGLVIF